MANKKKKDIDRAFVAISPEAHAIIKEFADSNALLLGKFVEIAALEKIEREKGKKK